MRFLPPPARPPAYATRLSDGADDQGAGRPGDIVAAYEFLLLGYDVYGHYTTSPDAFTKYDPVEHAIGTLRLLAGWKELVQHERRAELGLHGDRAGNVSDVILDKVLTEAIENLRLRLLRRELGPRPTYSGLPIDVAVWPAPFEEGNTYVAAELNDLLEKLKKGGYRPGTLEKLKGVAIPTPKQTVQALTSVNRTVPASIRASQLFALLDDGNHCFSTDHGLVLFRCNVGDCSVCPGKYRDNTPEIINTFGNEERGWMYALLMHPIPDEQRPGHYLPLPRKAELLKNHTPRSYMTECAPLHPPPGVLVDK